MLQTRRAYVRERFPRSALKQLQQSEHEERLAHLQAQKFSGVLLDQHHLFVHCFSERSALMDIGQEELYFSLFSSIQSYKAKKDTVSKGSANNGNLKTTRAVQASYRYSVRPNFSNYLRKLHF